MTWWGWILLSCFIAGGTYQLAMHPHYRQAKRHRWTVGGGARVGPLWLGAFRRWR